MHPLSHSILAVCLALAAGAAQAANPASDCTPRLKSPPGAAAQALAQEAAQSNPCATVPGMGAKSLASVWNALLTSSTTGGKRFENVPPVGTPSGRVLAGPQGIVFDLQTVAADGLVRLQLSTGGAVVLALANPSALVAVPLASLRPGVDYDWTLSTRKNSYRASFELLDAAQAAEVQARLEGLKRASLSPHMLLLYTAAVYDEAELYTARDEVLAQLRRQIAP